MHTFVAFAVTYVVGGLTFIPLLLALVLLHAHLTFPERADDATCEPPKPSTDPLQRPSDDAKSLLSDRDALASKFSSKQEKDVAEGYFAVCREYVPGGVNGKPPVRATPAGEVVTGESPSVYQSMYRSLFERRQASSTIDVGKNDSGKTARRARNIFYVVLRHGHLMLYDDAEQVEVRHVISLAYHDVSIYNGGSEIPEGELWIKRNAIRLNRKVAAGDSSSASLPFYFFSENCSDKENFYFALLQNQEQDGDDMQPPPQAETFDVKHIIALVQKLHSSEEQLQTRWLNAMVGRLFLAVYKTQEVEDFIRTKITKKIARVKKPGFISAIQLRKIHLGESAPQVTSPHLKDLTIDGDCCVEADVKYDGLFRLELATTVKIDLGARFKAREVDIVLSVVVKKLEGHVLVRAKPPPSNRLWIAFEKMPRLQLSIEPIVSTRQITYSVILRAIENRIREVIAETIVLPQWDDTPFLSTAHSRFRGGIWARKEKDSQTDVVPAIPNDDSGNESEMAMPVNDSSSLVHSEKSISMPSLLQENQPGSTPRKSHKASRSELSNFATTSGSDARPKSPTVVRSKSFAATAGPILNRDIAISNVRRSDTGSNSPKNAAALMTELSNRSQPSSPFEPPIGSLPRRRPSLVGSKDSTSISTASSRNSVVDELSNSKATITESSRSLGPPSPIDRGSRPGSIGSANGDRTSSKLQAMAKTVTPSERKQQALFQAAAAAKTWGWNTLNRKGKRGQGSSPAPEADGTPDHPLGRGRPFPPPGMPLPPPVKRDSIASLNVPKRRPVPPPPLPQRNGSVAKTKPDLPSRGYQDESASAEKSVGNDGILVVAAPAEDEAPQSEPDDEDGYGDFMDNVLVDEDDTEKTAHEPISHHLALEPASDEALKTAVPDPPSMPTSERSYSDDDHGTAS